MSETAAHILVAGRNGQVASALAEALRPNLRITLLGRPGLDILDADLVGKTIDRLRPDIVINAAAYTAVDQAESDRDAAFALNADAAATLAAAAATHGAPIIHISTDYVFDGSKKDPYTEDDPTAPLGVYGASKLAGEQAVAQANPDHITLRTAWVYSPFGKNFVKTMLNLARQRDEISVVHDQIGNPTSAHDIAEAVLAIAGIVLEDRQKLVPGTYHLAGSGETSWAGLAEYVFEVSRRAGGPSATVRPIPSSAYPTPVVRPANSRLDSSQVARTFGITMPGWQQSVAACMARLLAQPD